MPKTKNPFAEVKEEELCSEDFAREQDRKDELNFLRNEFIIPTKADIANKHYGPSARQSTPDTPPEEDSEQSVYLCGNSLGLQPRRTREYIARYLDTWATKGVYGHHKAYEGGLPPWLQIDDAVKEQSAKMVGALPSEVVVMETLTANLHLLMTSFYRPTKQRYKIIIEGKAFPSDHFAVHSQLALHGHPPSALITIDPPSSSSPYLSTEHILSVISQHAATTALVLLPGIQFYSGQFFDIDLITHHCHSLGLTIGWDLAHAVGNIPLKLHDWNVDFAAWCNYKYMNSGPGAIGGLFVHERHGNVQSTSPGDGRDKPNAESEQQLVYRPRLSGWWGSDKTRRFLMDNIFVPIPGASGWQLSNPSALDMTSVMASLDVFALTDISKLREKSIRLTAYLEQRLLRYPEQYGGPEKRPYRIITPENPAERGAQLSVLLDPGLLDDVMEDLEAEGVVVDERRPDVVRVAPAPLYNSYLDVWRFVKVFQMACERAREGEKSEGSGHGKATEDGSGYGREGSGDVDKEG